MPDVPSEEPLERSAQPEADAEPEHQERSAMAKLDALRDRIDPKSGPEDRLWSELGRSMSILERRLTSIEEDQPYFADAAGSAEAVRNIAETLDRLGLLQPPPAPVEAPEPDVSEVWVAALETGISTEQCDKLAVRLRLRDEARG